GRDVDDDECAGRGERPRRLRAARSASYREDTADPCARTLPRIGVSGPVRVPVSPSTKTLTAGGTTRSGMTSPPDGKEVVTLAGGCFWCLQPIFQDLKGVEKVEVGYSGGRTKNPTYEDVCTDSTGHAEAVEVTYDPKAIPTQDLLKIFFTVHDPTTLNRQGHDIGTQYRSAVFYRTPEQKAAVDRVIAEIRAAKLWDDPIVHEVS